MRHAPTFVVYEDSAGEWRWRLVAANGRIVADGSEGYRSRSGARRAANRVRELVCDLPFPKIEVAA